MAQRFRRGRGLRRWALLILALVPSCGGGVPNTITGGSGQPKRSVVDERSWALEPLQTLAVDINITGGFGGSATLDAAVEWTFASDDVDLYVTATACTLEMFGAERCAYKAKADGATTKPERVSFGVSDGGTYRFWIVNFGPQAESGTFSAGLTQ